VLGSGSLILVEEQAGGACRTTKNILLDRPILCISCMTCKGRSFGVVTTDVTGYLSIIYPTKEMANRKFLTLFSGH